jgi:hypothetical protein
VRAQALGAPDPYALLSVEEASASPALTRLD